MYLRFFLIIFFLNNGETDATGFNRHKTFLKKKLQETNVAHCTVYSKSK